MVSDVIKSWWANILLYGLSLGLLLAALQFSQYRLLTIGNAEKWYIGLVAILFAGVGIWAGRKLIRKNSSEPTPISAEFLPKEAVLKQLGITPRELEVLQQMAQGLSNQEIAEKLYVSLNTVKTHTSNLFSKLGVLRRTQAIQRAKAIGLLE
ncbi:MAG: LuxR C-terminal-related transcriptional regulator [Saprospiraceae bacterium]|nr:LuxR C-terminal-related transcriptional regulator [Saprospiraceae bacterium]